MDRKEYYKTIDGFNKDKDKWSEPVWGTDCNFKTDFDGPLVNVESRFYMCGKGWEGAVRINFLGKEIIEQEFKADSLPNLKVMVEDYVKEFSKKIKIE